MFDTRSTLGLATTAVLALTGCPDQSLTAFNADPSATITSPEDGSEVQEGFPVSLRGSVSDPDDSNDSLTATWYLGDEVVCSEATADWDGATSCEMVFSAEEDVVTLEVKDPQGAAGADSISLVVVPTDAPDAEIISPEYGGVYYSDRLITFEGSVSDNEDSPSDLTAWWESSIDGELEVDAEPDTSGGVLGSGYLSEGEHSVELRVEDSTGKVGQDNVVITVGPPNTAPQCQIIAPESGSVGQEGELVTFEAEVSDVDVPSDWLTVTWESDKDGELGSSSPNSDGSVTFAWSDLSVDTHTVTMRVSDEVDATCTDSLLYTVGTPPDVNLTSPGEGEVVNDGGSVTFSAEVSDNEDSPTSLTLSWESDLDGAISTQGADSGGVASFDFDSLSTGEHTITLTVVDTDGLYSTDRVSFTINALPSAPTVSISPDPAYTGDALLASANGSVDPDASGTVTYSYAWYESGVLSSASSSATFPASATTKGLVYRVVVTPSDGTGAGEPGEAELTIDNTDPVVGTPVISPSTGVTTTEVLACTASATDADGDTPAVTYGWSNSTTGSTLGSGASLTLTSSSVSPGDVVSCAATATDDEGAMSVASATLTVENTDPVLAAVVIDPSAGVTTSATLVCSATATDADGGTPTITYSWSSGATSLGTGSSLLLTPASSSPGDVVSCTATAFDADGGTDSDGTSVTVGNTDPVVDSVAISPSTGVTTSEVLTCTAIASDADGGSPTLSYAWSNGTVPLGTRATMTLSPSSCSPGDTIACAATALDADGGTGSGSSSVSVINSAPTVSSVAIRPDPAFAADTLTCGHSGFYDPDGDADASTYSWSVGGGVVGTASSLSAAFLGGDTVTCTVTPFDGTDSGTAVSDSLEVSNTPPDLDDVVLSPDPAYEGDSLTCAPGSYADDDGDSVTFSYGWLVEGVDPGETGSTLSSAWFDRDEAVSCTVTPSDGMDDGAAVGSNVVVISNSPPSISTVTVSPASPTASDTLTCSYSGYSDADGDADASTYTWTAGGTIVGSSRTLSGAFGSGDTVVCTVTPHDGTDPGTAVSDSVVVENEPPEVLSVTLSPSSVYTNDTITATVSTSDPDGDYVTVSYAWYVDGTLVAETGSSLDGAVYFEKDQEVYVVVTPNDGVEVGLPMTSSTVTIQNSAPTTATVAISPEVPVEGIDDMVCVIEHESDDADGDGVTYTFTWSVDGTSWGGGTDTTVWEGDTVGVDDIAARETWKCTVVPTDGSDDGASAEAEVEVVSSFGGELNLSLADAKLLGEAANDNAGYSVSSAGDVNADGYGDVLIGAYYEDAGGTDAGAIYLKLGPFTGISNLSAADAKFIGTADYDYAGRATSAGDVNDDGYDDILVGASGDNPAGAAYIIHGPASGTSSLSAADAKLTGESTSDHAGTGIAPGGDINGDGYADVIVGAAYEDSGGSSAGAVYLVFGPITRSKGLSAADAKLIGESSDDRAGLFNSAADTNGDGFDDVLVGAFKDDSGGSDAGAVYLVLGPTTGNMDLSSSDAKLIGERGGDYAGYAVSTAGDVNADGYEDIAVGAFFAGHASGTTYVVLGPVSGNLSLADADAIIAGESSYDDSGNSLAGIGDMDGDGNADLLIGSPGECSGGTDAGAAYIVLGPMSGSFDLSSADAKFIGEYDYDEAGERVSSAGDVDADGTPDLLVGARGEDTTGYQAGSAYLILGGGLSR